MLNNKINGTWGHAVGIPLSVLPVIFGEDACTLLVQINHHGFDVVVNDKYVARLPHPTPLHNNNNHNNNKQQQQLVLNLPATDDYNHPEDWTVCKVWWGWKAPILADTDASSIHSPTKTNEKVSSVTPDRPSKILNLTHPRKLFLRGLCKLQTDAQIELRKAELERAFFRYGGARGATVIAPKHKTFAFVEFESAHGASLALREMSSQYCLTRARYTRQEALNDQKDTMANGTN